MYVTRKTINLSILLSLALFFSLLPLWKALGSYLNPVFLLVVWGCITGGFFFLMLLIRGEHIQVPPKAVLGMMAIYSFLLMVLLFSRPAQQEYNRINLIPLSTIKLFLSGRSLFLPAFYNLAANILLFVPFGVYTLWAKPLSVFKKWKLILVPAMIICFIESAQHITGRGSLDIDDLILNLSGVFLGYLLYPLAARVMVKA
ncbi:VanZ family protein [Peribacillus sp. SCS-37]|uniref:VanZ family protein n=1 Tax=Paraperibacillus esterisolvens TaxID=3115296 RepID=UPI003905F7DE